jgi:DNA-binding response OmpR family regulator
MSLSAIVFGKTLIVRQPVAQSLATLDFRVIEMTDLGEVMARIDSTGPSLLVMDSDGMAREWRMLSAILRARSAAPSLVLLASRFSFNDAHEAMALKVSAVIVKPFRREEHTPRLLDIALRQKSLKARRAFPRFAVPDNTTAVLKTGDPGEEKAFPVQNFAREGVKVSAEGSDGSLTPGSFMPLATFSVGNADLEVSADVVHHHDGTAGVRFSRLFDSPQKLMRVLDERETRAFGGKGRKRKW